MKIRTGSEFRELDECRPAGVELKWELVLSGRWDDDRYHGGYIEYQIANVSGSTWILEGRERKAELDYVTEEDVEEGRLNDDQIQAMWGMTLEEAQAAEFCFIAAYCEDVPKGASVKDVAKALYGAVCENDGKRVSEVDLYGCLDDEDE